MQFLPIVRSGTGRVFTDLRPDPFGRIQLGRAGRKFVHMQTRMASQKVLNLPTAMNWMLIPDQNDRPSDAPQQVFQKGHHFVSRD